MLKRQIAFVWTLFSVFALNAQSDLFFQPSKAIKGYTYQIEIQNHKDLDYLKAHLKEFQYIEKLKINGEIDIAPCAEVASKLDNLQEIQLKHFQGILSDADLLALEWIPTVQLFVPNGKEDALLFNSYWNKLEHISLEFEVAPDHFEFMKGWKHCKELQMIGPWTCPEIASAMVEWVNYVPQLQQLTFSLNRLNHLPSSVRGFKSLKKLMIIDASALTIGSTIESLSEVLVAVNVGEKKVAFGDGANKTQMRKYIKMPFVYCSNNAEISANDLKYIKKVYPDGPAEDNYEWIESQVELDFVQSIPRVNPKFSTQFPTSLSPVLLNDFKDGIQFFEGESKKNQLFTSKGQWTLLVPANAFCTPDKKPYNGNYFIKIRFIQNPEQLLACAPNMVYDSSQSQWPLNAAFVVDIQCYTNQGMLEVEQGQFLQFHAIAPSLADSRFYAFNFREKKWNHFYDYDYQFSDDHLQKVDFYNFYGGQKTAKLYAAVDQSDLDVKFDLLGSNYLLAPEQSKAVIEIFKDEFVNVQSKSISSNHVNLKKGTSLIGLRAGLEKIEGINEPWNSINIYDKTKKLFPEFGVFEDYPLYFRTSLDRKTYNRYFFKAMKFFDARIQEFGGQWVLELKSNEGNWQIQLVQPKEIYKEYPKKAKKFQNQFLDLIAKYQKRRAHKNDVLIQIQQMKAQKEVDLALKNTLSAGNLPKGKARYQCTFRSTGRFAFANPAPIQSAKHFDAIFCEVGKIPLRVSQFAVVSENPMLCVNEQSKPNSTAKGNLQRNDERFELEISPDRLSYIVVKDMNDRIYGMSGDQFRKMNVPDHSIQYLELKELPSDINSPEKLTEYFHIKRKNQ